jgi:hypothetical protein
MYLWRKPEYQEKTPDVSKVTDQLNIVTSTFLYTSHCVGFKITSLMVLCTDSIGSCKFNYHTIATTMSPIG